MIYRLTVLVHLVFVLLFVGNFVAAWLVWARARTIREPVVLAQLYHVVNAGDRWLTPVPVIVILVSGVLAARMGGLSVAGTGWILWSLIALGFSGIVFVARLSGLQRELALADGRVFDLSRYRRRLVSWGWWAAAGTAAVVVAIVLMVLKPGLPGF